MIKSSENVIGFIKGEEGFRKDKYDDGYGNITQGFGNTAGDMEKPKTEDEAEMDLINRVRVAEEELSRVVKRGDLSQGQMDVLVDMHYNMGLPKMKDFIDLVNSRQDVDISEELLKYNKAFNKHTNQYEVAPGLVSRSKKRSEMWRGSSQSSAVLDNVLSSIDSMTRPDDEILAALEAVDSSTEMEQQYDPARRSSNLETISQIADPEEALRNSEARRLARDIGIPFDDARNRLVDKDYKTLVAERSHDIIANHFPAVAEWVNRDPDNYVMLRESGNWAPRVELAARNTRRDERSDWVKSLDNNRVMLKEALTYLGMIRGQQSFEEGQKVLLEVDRERQENSLSSKEARNVLDVINNVDSSTFDKLSAMFKNPEATAQIMLQSQGSTVAVMGASIGAGVGGTLAGGPVAGAAAGALSAYTVSHLLSYSEYMSGQLEEFRDPVTGIIDVKTAFSDPDRFRRWQTEADIYGLSMGVSDAAFSLIGGKIGKGVAKHIFKSPATSAGGAAARKTTEIVAEASSKMVEEGGSQLIASSSVDIYKGDGLKNLKENLNEAENEALLSAGPGISMTLVRHGVAKTAKVLEKANRANEDLVAVAALRQEVNSNEAAKNDPDKVRELLQQSLDNQRKPDDPNAPIIEDTEPLIDSQIKAQEKEAVLDTTTIAPSEFEAFYGSREEALKALQHFGPDVVQAYANARQTDTSIQIPTSDWVLFTIDNPEIDAIARFNGNELNGKEANQEIEAIENKPYALFDRTVYHGSPFDFEKFSEGAIGSGEGAQAYGFGLYFTEDQSIAEWYRNNLSKEKYAITPEIKGILASFDNLGFDSVSEAVNAIRTSDDWVTVWDVSQMDPKDILTINDFVAKSHKGQLFEVKLPNGLWIDLESSISSVPPDVAENLRSALKEVVNEETNVDGSPRENSVLTRFMNGEFLNKDYVTLGLMLSSLSNEEDKALTAVLSSKGFNGITYKGLDSGKRNYVVFVEDDIKIVRKFYDGKEEDFGITIVEADPNEPSNLKMRPVELYNRFRNDKEKNIHKSILSRLKKAMPKGTDVNSLEVFTELQYRHMQNRAEVLGVDIQVIADQLKIGKATKKESEEAHGVFRHNNIIGSAYTIVFADSADSKTLVHEFGHSWLYDMSLDYHILAGINPDVMTLAQKEYWIAMQHMAKLAGLDNVAELLNIKDEARVTHIHERWARTVEMYFLEGKFEDNNMKPLLDTFRKWMVAVIGRIKSVLNWTPYAPLKITPEIERTMEAILGASSYIDSEVSPLLPQPFFPEGVLGGKQDEYTQTILLARSNAIASAYTRFFNKGIREREATIDKELSRIYAQAEAEIDSQRSMILLAGFTEAYAEYRADPDGDTPDPRLSYESVAKVLFDGDTEATDKFKASIPRVFIAGKKKGGVSVENFMLLQDISSKEDLLNLMRETSRREEMIQQEAEAIIERDFPAIKSEDEIHEIAVQSVQEQGREKLLMKEMNILMDLYRGDFKKLVAKLINPPAYIGNPSKENLKSAGERIVLNAAAYKFNAGKFLNDSLRLGKEASKLFRKNNIVEAIDSKVNESVQFFAFKFALKAQKAVAQTTLRVQQFAKYAKSKDVLRKFDTDIMDFGKQVIQLAGHGQDIPHLSREGFSPLSGASNSHIETINKKIEEYKQVSKGRVGKNVSVEAYVALGDLLKTITFVAAQAKEVEIGLRRLQIDNVGEGIVNQVSGGNVVDVSGKGVISSLRQSVVNLRTVFESMHDSPEAFSQSYLGKLFYAVTNAESTRSIELKKHKDRISKAIKATVGDAGFVAPLVRRLPVPARWKMDKNSKPILLSKSDGFARDFTFKNKGELHMANLLMGSESGAKKFLLGHGFFQIDPETLEKKPDFDSWNRFIERMIKEGSLTRKDFEMYDTIWKSFEEIHPLVKTAMRRSDGFNMGYIEGWKVKNSLGEFTGGYVPVTPVREMMSPGMTESLLEVDSMGYRIDSLYPSMNTGMTNERTDQYTELNLDMSRLYNYLSAALNIAYLRNPLLDFGKVLELKNVREAIEGRRPGIYGDAKNGMIIRWFNAVKAQEYTEFSNDLHERVARHLRMNVNLAMYLGSWTTVVKQFLGFLPSMARVGTANLMVATLRTGLGTFKHSREVMMEKSVMMRNRLSNSQEQMIRSWDELDTNFDWISWTSEKVQSLQWMFIQMTQNMVDTATWQAGYERMISRGASEQDAINFADDSVRVTQSSPEVSNLSNIQRGKDSHKLVMMVTSVPISMNNLIQAELMRDQSAVNRAKALATISILAFILPNMLDGIFGEITNDQDEGDEDEEEALNKAIGLVALRTATGSIDSLIPLPYTRIFTSAVQFGTGSATPGLSKPASSIAKSAKGVQNLGRGVDLTTKEMAGIFDTITITTGLPSSIIGKVFTFYDQFIMDEREKEDRKYDRREQLAIAREQ